MLAELINSSAAVSEYVSFIVTGVDMAHVVI